MAAVVSLLLLNAGACAPPGPLVVNAPAAVIPERPRSAPRQAIRWYNDFWSAVGAVNLKAAWILADTRDQRRFADVLQYLFDGDDASAESTVVPLLASRDTVVGEAARLTYGVILSSENRWGRLAALSDSATRAMRDDAGIESWAPAFRNVHERIEFGDTVVVLPLTRSHSGAPVVSILLNGVRKSFWIDTGSSISIIASNVAAECHVDAIGHDTLQLLTAVGRLPARPAAVSSLQLGTIHLDDTPAMIVDASALELRSAESGMGTERIDGVIGFDVIRELDVTIDDGRGRVVIRKPAASRAHGHTRNLAWFGVPIVSAVSESGAPVHLALDTGAEETFGTPTLVTKTGARWSAAERRNVRGFGANAVERGLVIPSVRLFVGDVPISFKRVFLYEALYPTIFTLDGTLGSDVGRGGVLRIDMTNGRLDITRD